jgi:hypothetical protein
LFLKSFQKNKKKNKKNLKKKSKFVLFSLNFFYLIKINFELFLKKINIQLNKLYKNLINKLNKLKQK